MISKPIKHINQIKNISSGGWSLGAEFLQLDIVTTVGYTYSDKTT